MLICIDWVHVVRQPSQQLEALIDFCFKAYSQN